MIIEKPFIDVNNTQSFIKYDQLPEKIIIDGYINKINNQKEPYLAELYIHRITNISELLELEKRIFEIIHPYVRDEIKKWVKKYKTRMNKLQYYYAGNIINQLLKQIPDDDLVFYVRYFNDEYGTLTETGIEIAKIINEVLKRRNLDAETIRINNKTK